MSASRGVIIERAVAQQLRALAHPEYEVGLLDADLERMDVRRWHSTTILQSLGYLRDQNTQGKHIYVRPAAPHSYTLLAGLDANRLKALRDAGFAPSLVVGSSPGNFQAWIDHGVVLSATLSTAVAELLARRFGADMSSAGGQRFGRLAGFTNRKATYRKANGHYPAARLIDTGGSVNTHASSALIAAVENAIADAHDDVKPRCVSYDRWWPDASGQLRKAMVDFSGAAKGSRHASQRDVAFATSESPRARCVPRVLSARDRSHDGGEG